MSGVGDGSGGGEARRARETALREHGRSETVEERADRRWSELMTEVRVAQTGTQILFGFLLTVAFQPRFQDLSQADRNIYVLTVVLGAATMGSLIAPAAFHRMVVGRRLKPQAVTWAARLTLLGLGLMVLTMGSAVLLVLRVTLDDALAAWLTAGVVLWFVLCWFVLPFYARRSGRLSRGE
ncbi:DUF6328 family protein [Streptomyces sp. NPDC060194]|uniref:DUF6328 family protein n=1 Tax=Streptomyces sp. NPDC060194 TaxID=3347069 RepID=UPI003655623B